MCQKAILGKIGKKGGDYVVGLKGNQGAIHSEVANYFEQAHDVGFDGVPVSHNQSVNKGHGRLEQRDVYVTNEIDWLPMKDEWPNLQAIVMVDSKRTLNGKSSREVRYYLTSLGPEAARLAHAIRTHWGIENKVHWVLDVTFHQDRSQKISTGHAAENLSILRRLSLNILRLDSDKRTSLRAKRKKAGWNNASLAEFLNLLSSHFNEKTLPATTTIYAVHKIISLRMFLPRN
jgi:predicted transposase YbfD/YdcC